MASPSRSRTASFRRSVITVAAAFAPLAGCPGPQEHVSENPPICAGGDDDVPGCMPSTSCPQATPQQGNPCAYPHGQLCDYEPCGDVYPTISAECLEGRWEVYQVTCNLPPPPPDVCPDEAPTDGATCGVSPSESCAYGDCYGSPTIDAKCMDGVWSVSEVSCNPPPMECPEEPPLEGESCFDQRDNTCNYGDCYGQPTTTATCTEGAWKLEDSVCNPPPVDECPAEQPEQDAPCTHVGDACGYGNCGGVPVVAASCVNGAWDLLKVSCNPPPLEP